MAPVAQSVTNRGRSGGGGGGGGGDLARRGSTWGRQEVVEGGGDRRGGSRSDEGVARLLAGSRPGSRAATRNG